MFSKFLISFAITGASLAETVSPAGQEIRVPVVVNHLLQPTSRLAESEDGRLLHLQQAATTQRGRQDSIAAQTMALVELRKAQSAERAQRTQATVNLASTWSSNRAKVQIVATESAQRSLAAHLDAAARRSQAANASFAVSAAEDAKVGQVFAGKLGGMLHETVVQVGETQRESIRAVASLGAAAMGVPVAPLSDGDVSATNGISTKPAGNGAARVKAPGVPGNSIAKHLDALAASPAHDNAGTSGAECRPQRSLWPSLDSLLLTPFGYGSDSCCGASRDCSHLDPSCFAPGSQEDVCRQHDTDLVGLSAWDANNPRVYQAHRKGAARSPSILMRLGLGFMENRSLTEPTEKTWLKSGLPFATAPELPPET